MGRLFKRGAIYYCYVPKPEGGVGKKSTNCTDEKAAHARASELEREALDPDGAAAKKATVRDAIELLIRDRRGKAKAGKRSSETVTFYLKKAGVLLDGLAELLRRSPKAEIYLHEMKPGLVDDYIAMRRDDGAKDSTIGKELTTWRVAMQFAKRRRWLRADIDELFPQGFSGASEDRDRWCSPAEFLKLYDAFVRPAPVRQPTLAPDRIAELRTRRLAGENLRALAAEFGVSYPTATRLSRRDGEPELGPARGHELFAIVCFIIATSAEWSAIWRARRPDIAPDHRSVRVRGSKNENRKDRPVPIELLPFAFCLDFAAAYGDGCMTPPDGQGEFLFDGSHESSFRRRLAEACDRAGIPHLTPTDLRRTHAQWLRRSGVAPGTIAPSMGHADSRMVERKYGKATALELAGVQRAQIAFGGGSLMGRAPHVSVGSDALGREPNPRLQPENLSAQRRNRTADTGIFNPPGPADEGPRNANSPTRWDANGPLDSAQRAASAKAEVDGVLGSGPASAPSSSAHVFLEDRSSSPSREIDELRNSSISRPGVAKVADGAVGVRVDVDGRTFAETALRPGEPVADAEARLRLAAGQRGGVPR